MTDMTDRKIAIGFLVSLTESLHGGGDKTRGEVIFSDDPEVIVKVAQRVFPKADPEIAAAPDPLARSSLSRVGYMCDRKTRDHLCTYTVTPVLVVANRLFELQEI